MPTTENQFLEDVKRNNIERLVSHLNGVGASIIQAYPMAEVQSWPVQKAEAEKILAAGQSSVPSMAPFITMVCIAHFGPYSSEVELISRVRVKAAAIKQNADLWAALSAFVNGLRARVSDAIEASTTETDAHRILHEAFTELEQFRSANGI